MFHGELARHPIPSFEEQVQLGRSIRRWLSHPDGEEGAPREIRRRGKAALDRLVSGNLRLVVSMAGNYFNRVPTRIEESDLVSVGIEGLIRAARKFDPERGYRFSTYATWWIRQAMQREARRGGLIRTPDHVGELAVKAKAVAGRLMGEQGREPTVAEVADAIGGGISPERVREALEAWNLSTPVSVNSLVKNTEGLEILDGLAGEDDSWEQTEREERVVRVRRALARLDGEAQQLVRAVYLEGRTMRELSRELRITPEAVRQRMNRAKTALRLALAEQRAAIP